MDKTLYANLTDNLFALRNKKDNLTNQINQLNAQREEVSRQISDLDFILTMHGKHVYENYIEEREVEHEDN